MVDVVTKETKVTDTVVSLDKKELQTALKVAGFYTGEIDGISGPLMRGAVDDWFRSGMQLSVVDIPKIIPETPVTVDAVVPGSWMQKCAMKGVVVHWTAGSYRASDIDKEHYHIMVEGSGAIVRGDHTIEDNLSTFDGDYAAHTRACNTGFIGVSLCGMAGAVEAPFNAGVFPILEAQWKKAARVVAELCRFYKIAVTPQTVLQHGEVQKNLGIQQNGKWDCMVLPWNRAEKNAGEAFRQEVIRNLK